MRFRNGSWERINDPAAEEIRLRIQWNDPLGGASGSAELWAWPHQPEHLVLGHVLLECLPGSLKEGKGSAAGVDDLARKRRSAVVTPLGGHTYAVELGAIASDPEPVPPTSWSVEALLAAMRGFMEGGGGWEETGCFHRAGVFDPRADRLVRRVEDIGRNNCLDRLAGWSAAEEVPLSDKVLLTSARITANYCAKALRAGFHILVGRSAVTGGSVALAESLGVTLVGFARTEENRFTVFADGPGRLVER